MGRGISSQTKHIIRAAHAYLEDQHPATVRGVCYFLFVHKLIPNMKDESTKRISDIITRARERDEIDPDWIVQEGRQVRSLQTYEDPAEFGRSMQEGYLRNKWIPQPKTIIVISEKATVEGILQPVLDEFEVDFLAVGGFASFTRVHALVRATREKPLLIIYGISE
jgi:hypothetical protein